MVLMNGLLVINDEPSGIVRNIPCLTPLQIHLLMSCAFGLICLIGTRSKWIISLTRVFFNLNLATVYFSELEKRKVRRKWWQSK